MKLFQKLLLAPAALGLFAPVVANANESNFRDVTSYSQNQVEISLDTFKPLSNKNPLLAGGEGVNHSHSDDAFDVDTFSSTTTASFASSFALGAVQGDTHTDDPGMNYEWETTLTSSISGDDSLEVVINAGTSNRVTELDMTSTSDSQLQVDTLTYSKALGDRVTAFLATGDGVAGSALYNTACIYGAQTDTFSDCGVSAANIDEGLGTAFGVSFDYENGFSVALGYEGQGMTSNGFLTEGGTDAFGGQVSYTTDAYGVSVSFANIDNHSSANVRSSGATQSTGFNAYFSPELSKFPTISAGIESNHNDSVDSTSTDDTSHYFIGLQWEEIGDGTLGVALGSKEPTAENGDSLTMYEVFYSYNYADGITLTPLIYSKDDAGKDPSETGIVLKADFSF